MNEWMEEIAKAQLAIQEALLRLTERIDRVEAQIEGLSEQIGHLAGVVKKVDDWRKGEITSYEYEIYEKQVVRRALSIFMGGKGGSPEDAIVKAKLRKWLEKFFEKGILISEEEDPLLADLIWWSGNKVAVVEISLMVDRLDVIGAKKRSAFLKSLGIDSFPLVIGRGWATPEAEALAQVEEVEWLIGDDYSEGFYEFQLACRGRKD